MPSEKKPSHINDQSHLEEDFRHFSSKQDTFFVLIAQIVSIEDDCASKNNIRQ